MTGLEALALAVGTTVGLALGARAWRRDLDPGPAEIAEGTESAAERELRQRCDAVIDHYRRLAEAGAIDPQTLQRASFLHDVATNAGRASERAAATHQLLAMTLPGVRSRDADTPRAPHNDAPATIAVSGHTPLDSPRRS